MHIACVSQDSFSNRPLLVQGLAPGIDSRRAFLSHRLNLEALGTDSIELRFVALAWPLVLRFILSPLTG